MCATPRQSIRAGLVYGLAGHMSLVRHGAQPLIAALEAGADDALLARLRHSAATADFMALPGPSHLVASAVCIGGSAPGSRTGPRTPRFGHRVDLVDTRDLAAVRKAGAGWQRPCWSDRIRLAIRCGRSDIAEVAASRASRRRQARRPTSTVAYGPVSRRPIALGGRPGDAFGGRRPRNISTAIPHVDLRGSLATALRDDWLEADHDAARPITAYLLEPFEACSAARDAHPRAAGSRPRRKSAVLLATLAATHPGVRPRALSGCRISRPRGSQRPADTVTGAIWSPSALTRRRRAGGRDRGGGGVRSLEARDVARRREA